MAGAGTANDNPCAFRSHKPLASTGSAIAARIIFYVSLCFWHIKTERIEVER